MKLQKMAAVAVSVAAATTYLVTAGVPAASASASASASATVADRLAGSAPKDVTNCGERTCTTYFNRASTRAWAENLPSIMENTDYVIGLFCGTVTGKLHWLAGVGASFGCEAAASKTGLHEIARQAELADAAKGCLEVEKAGGGIIRVGYTTHSDWCGGR